MTFGQFLVMPMMVFGGLFKNVNQMPSWYAWMTYLSPIYWAFDAMCKIEFDGNKSCHEAGATRLPNCNYVPLFLGMTYDYWRAI